MVPGLTECRGEGEADSRRPKRCLPHNVGSTSDQVLELLMPQASVNKYEGDELCF